MPGHHKEFSRCKNSAPEVHKVSIPKAIAVQRSVEAVTGPFDQSQRFGCHGLLDSRPHKLMRFKC